MKKRIQLASFALVYLSLSPVLAQPKEEVVAYFDINWKQITKSDIGITYFRTVERQGTTFVVRDYNAAKTLRMKAECSAYTPKLIRNGKATYYDDNGKIDEEGTFKNDNRTGRFKYYYNTGKLKEELEYINGDTRHLQFYSEAGQTLLINGTGTTRSQESANVVAYQKIENYKKVKGYFIKDSRDTIYAHIDRLPEYREGGTEALMYYIWKAIKYPQSALNKRIQGTVFVSFLITEHGTAQDFKIIKGIHAECNAEAIRVVKLLRNKWYPAIHKNRVVAMQYVLPIKFELPQ